MSKLELVVMAGPESKAFLAELTEQLDRMEKLSGAQLNVTKANKKAAEVVEEEPAEETEDDDGFAAKPAARAGKKASPLDDEEDTEVIEPKTAKGKKAAKVSMDDVIDACKAAAKETSRDKVLRILEKKFKVTSVQDLDEDQYAAVIKELE